MIRDIKKEEHFVHGQYETFYIYTLDLSTTNIFINVQR